MLGFHWPELVIILLVAVLIFGPRRVPVIGAALGRGLKDFRKGVRDLERETGIDEVRDLAKKELSELHSAVKDVPHDPRASTPPQT